MAQAIKSDFKKNLPNFLPAMNKIIEEFLIFGEIK